MVPFSGALTEGPAPHTPVSPDGLLSADDNLPEALTTPSGSATLTESPYHQAFLQASLPLPPSTVASLQPTTLPGTSEQITGPFGFTCASVEGDASCQVAAVSGTGNATGYAPISAKGDCNYRDCIGLEDEDNARGHWAASSIRGDAGGPVVTGIATAYDGRCLLTEHGNVECDGHIHWPHREHGGHWEAAAVDIATTQLQTCVILESGDAECWGFGGEEKPGYTGGDAVQITTGSLSSVDKQTEHACVLTEAGNVECWGDNDQGQADGYEGGDAVHVSAEAATTCALIGDGTIECWGDLLGGAAGYDEGDAIDVSTGHQGICILTTDRSIMCTGEGPWDHFSLPDEAYATVSTSHDNLCAVTLQHTIHCIGEEPAYDGHDVEDVSAGGSLVCVITTAQEARCSNDGYENPQGQQPYLAASGTGDATSQLASASGTGDAHSRYLASASGEGNATCRMEQGYCASVSGTGDAKSNWGPSTSVLGDASGTTAISGGGDADGTWLGASGTGSAHGLWIGASILGDSSCAGWFFLGLGCIAASGTGEASGIVAVSGCQTVEEANGSRAACTGSADP